MMLVISYRIVTLTVSDAVNGQARGVRPTVVSLIMCASTSMHLLFEKWAWFRPFWGNNSVEFGPQTTLGGNERSQMVHRP